MEPIHLFTYGRKNKIVLEAEDYIQQPAANIKWELRPGCSI